MKTATYKETILYGSIIVIILETKKRAGFQGGAGQVRGVIFNDMEVQVCKTNMI